MSISPIAPTYTPPLPPAPQPVRATPDHDLDADDHVGQAMRNAALSDEGPPAPQAFALQSETNSSSGHVDVRA